MLTFEVASFDIGCNCILGRSFLLKLMAIIHTAHATMKMPRPKAVITIKVDQWDTLACENASLSYVGRFGAKAAQEQSAKAAKTQGDNTPLKTSMPKPPIGSTPQTSIAKKGAYAASPSTQPPTNQPVDYRKKETDDTGVQVDPSNLDNKLRIGTSLYPK
jgi:hypothetical protein